jgi:co-chaperonin GroES (HSP10)
MSVFDPRKIKVFKALHDHVVVTDMNFEEKISHGGIIIPHSDGKLEGIHCRWGRVYAVGPDQKDVKPGQYVLVKHGRWTRGIEIDDGNGEKTIRRIDNNDVLMVSDEPMEDETIGESMGVYQKSR